jgi:hypothetical protein
MSQMTELFGPDEFCNIFTTEREHLIIAKTSRNIVILISLHIRPAFCTDNTVHIPMFLLVLNLYLFIQLQRLNRYLLSFLESWIYISGKAVFMICCCATLFINPQYSRNARDQKMLYTMFCPRCLHYSSHFTSTHARDEIARVAHPLIRRGQCNTSFVLENNKNASKKLAFENHSRNHIDCTELTHCRDQRVVSEVTMYSWH